MKNLEKLYKAEKHDSIKEYIEDAINKYSKKDAFIVKSQENNEIKYTHISFEEFGKQIILRETLTEQIKEEKARLNKATSSTINKTRNNAK